ncbi:beta-lactamase family protein [Agrococcus terreus]|uniref:serine hydrolase domain-containing protein n=1 Tax=Agrococcus terreus TaxID=574649 RepID=UPI00384D3967
MRTRTTLTTAAAIAAGVALTGGATQPAPDPVPDPTALHQQLWQQAAPQARIQQAPGAPQAVPGEGGLDARGLDAAVERLVDDGAIAVTARVEVGDEAWAGAAGERTQDRRPPALPHSPFRAASNTKMLIATLVLQEVERGTWTLDTRVGDVDPTILPTHPDVTLRQLLSHTSGMPYGSDQLLLGHVDDPTSLDETIAALGDRYPDEEHLAVAEAGPWTAPGGFVYSNVGYTTLGVALEAVTGRSVADLLEERILDPLGMDRTRYPDEPGLRGTELREAMWDGAAWHDLQHFDPTYFSHAGALVSTTEDLATFTEALVTGELVSRPLLDEMLTPVSTEVLEYGLGVYRVPDPCLPGEYLYGHDGASLGTLSVAYTSADGERQVTMGVTGRDSSGQMPGLYDLNGLLVPMLLATC